MNSHITTLKQWDMAEDFLYPFRLCCNNWYQCQCDFALTLKFLKKVTRKGPGKNCIYGDFAVVILTSSKKNFNYGFGQ
jgi:hypothetical protein